MRHRRRVRKKTRTNNTANRRALSTSEVRAKILDLRKRWRYLDPVARGDRLRELTTMGCSMRGLAAELRRGLTTIRRYIDLAISPERVREAARKGWSVKRLIAHKQHVRQVANQDALLQEERKTGKQSDEAAELIIEFCRYLDYPSRTAAQLLPEARAALARPASHDVSVSRVRKDTPTKILFSMLKPEQPAGEFELAHSAKWLAAVLQSRFPLRPVQENALNKAAKRARELDPPRPSLADQYLETALRRQFIAEIPSRRKC